MRARGSRARGWVMKRKKVWLVSLLLVPLALVAPNALRAEDKTLAGVARVSVIRGDVSTQRGDSGDWVSTTVNAPLVRGDRIGTRDDSRAEVQLDYANVLRLDQNSEVKIADLTRDRIQLQVAQGTMDFTVFKGTQADVEIDTPNMAVQPLGEGTYRIQVISPEETEVIVRNGEAQVSTPQGNTSVKKNEEITVQGSTNPEYQIGTAPRRDDWDDWNRERDQAILDAQSYRYTNRYYTGAQDLDRYGRWEDVPGYGWAWSPYGPAGWVPYRYGRWVWEPFYGWTWVSYEPWGWAPYHYGRWFFYGSSWYWWPGYVTLGYYPLWAPAYVSFIGFGYGRYNFGFGFGYGFGSIGWLPLGPRDPFHRWWGRGNSFNVVNITNITNIINIQNITNVTSAPHGVTRFVGPGGSNIQGALDNSRIRSALTVASTQDFVSGRVTRDQRTIQLATLRSGQVVEGTLPAVPTRQSLRPVSRPAHLAATAAGAASRENFFATRRAPAGPQPFSERAAEIRQMVETRNDSMAAARAGSAGAAATASVAERAATTMPAAPGERPVWRRFGSGAAAAGEHQPGTANRALSAPDASSRFPAAAERSPRRTSEGGWRAFGADNSGAAVGSERDASRPAAAAPRDNQANGTPQASPRQTEAGQPGWRRFSNAPDDSNRRQGSASSSASGVRPSEQQAPRSFSPRSAPSAPQREQPAPRDNWRRFTPESRGPARQPSSEASGEAARPGWGRIQPNAGGESPSRGERNSGWNAPAPRSDRRVFEPSRGYERPPLQIRKPIVVERAPRSFEGGNRGGWGGRSAPQGRPSEDRSKPSSGSHDHGRGRG